MTEIRDQLIEIQLRLKSGDASEALAKASDLLKRHPSDPNVLLAAGQAASMANLTERALDLLNRAATLAPAAAAPQFWIGRTHKHAKCFIEAADAFRKSLNLANDNASALNLAACLYESGDYDRAGSAAVRATQLSAVLDQEAHLLAIACAGRLAPMTSAIGSSLASTASWQGISIICCSVTAYKWKRLHQQLALLLQHRKWQWILIEDAKSLSEAYMRGIASAEHDIVIFSHDDIEILGQDFFDRLVDALHGADIVGVAGTTKVAGPAVFWAGYPHRHGWVSHGNLLESSRLPTPMSFVGTRIDGAQALDGVFFAAHRRVVEKVQFDVTTFDGFHFYDLDFTYRAYLAGFKIRIQNDLLLVHESAGNFGEDHQFYAERFMRKFSNLPHVAPASPMTFRTIAPSNEETSKIYYWLALWVSETPH